MSHYCAEMSREQREDSGERLTSRKQPRRAATTAGRPVTPAPSSMTLDPLRCSVGKVAGQLRNAEEVRRLTANHASCCYAAECETARVRDSPEKAAQQDSTFPQSATCTTPLYVEG